MRPHLDDSLETLGLILVTIMIVFGIGLLIGFGLGWLLFGVAGS